MATVENIIDGARRKLDLPQWSDERQDATETAQEAIDAALRALYQGTSAHEGPDATDTALNVIDHALEKLRITTSIDEGADNTETAQHYIEQAMGLIGALDPDESASSAELADGTELLDAMIQGWIGEGVYLPNYTAVTASGDAVTVPVTAETAVIYSLATYMAAHYGATPTQEVVQIGVNTQNRLRRDPDQHLATLNHMLFQWEAEGLTLGHTLKLANTGTTINAPENAITAIVNNLAVLLAPEYGVDIPESVARAAENSKKGLRRDASDHLDTLNRMAEEFEASGIKLGWSTLSSLSATLPVKKGAVAGIIHNLALRLAPEYNIDPPATIVALATDEKTRLKRDEDDDMDALNYLLMDWQGDGINLGFQKVHSMGQIVPIPDTAERAVIFNLAMEIAPEYEIQVPPEVARVANDTKNRLRRNSMEPLISDMDHLPGQRRQYDIDTIN